MMSGGNNSRDSQYLKVLGSFEVMESFGFRVRRGVGIVKAEMEKKA